MRVILDAAGNPVGKFNRAKAEEIAERLDINGQGSVLLRTASGRLVLAHESQWANVPTVYTDDMEEILDFCASHNIDLPEGAGEDLEDLDRPVGRPEIGPAFSLRFPPDLLAEVDAAAEADGLSRAECIRRAARDYLAVRALNRATV
jgi:hypothetical protein